jgi:hypothetical protein
VLRASGREVDARADEFFALFDRPAAALEAAVAVQRAVSATTPGPTNWKSGCVSASAAAARR